MLVLFLQKESLSDVQLHYAAMTGDLNLLKRILDSGKVHVDSKDKVSHQMLHFSFYWLCFPFYCLHFQ